MKFQDIKRSIKNKFESAWANRAVLKKFYQTKQGIAAIAATVLALALLITAIVMSAVIPSGVRLAPSEGGAYTRVASSKYNHGVYYSDDKGNLYRSDDEGNPLYSSLVAEGENVYLNDIMTDPNTEYLFCEDINNVVYVLEDTGAEFRLVCKSTSNIALEKMLADEHYIYLVKKTGKAISLEKHEKSVFENGFPEAKNAVSRGTLYEVSVRSGEVSLEPANEPRPVGYGIDDGYLYIFCAAGRIFKINTDFAGLNQVNAWVNDDILTIDESEFDKDAYFVFGSMLSLCGAEYHKGQKTFYMLDTSANIYACTGDVFDYRNSERGVLDYSEYLKAEISFESGYGPINRNNDNSSSRNTPPMYLHEESNRLLIFFTSSNRVCGFDISDGLDRLFDSALEYNIRAVAYNGDGTQLFLCFTDNDNITFNLSVSSPNIYMKGVYKTLATVFFVLGALLVVTAGILIGCTFKSGFADQTKVVLKDLVKQKWVYVILACSLALLFIFCYYPAISSIALSFTDYTGANPSKQWNNFKNYVTIFTSMEAIRSFGNMLIFLLADIVTAIVPPLMFAFCLSIIRSKAYSKTARVLLFLPTILPSMATTLIWKFGIFGSSGALNTVVRWLTGNSDITVNFLFNNSWSLPSLIFMGFPWVGSYLIFYGAMMNIPSSYFEAAELEGCGLFKRFFKIDIPLITAQIKYVFIMSFIASVQNFGRVYTLTGGAYGTDIPINRMYSYLLAQDYGLAAAYATILFLFLLIATVFNLRMQTVERE